MNFSDYLSSKRSGNNHIKINDIPTASQFIEPDAKKRKPSPAKLFAKSVKTSKSEALPISSKPSKPDPVLLEIVDSDDGLESLPQTYNTQLIKPSEIIQSTTTKKRAFQDKKKPFIGTKPKYKYYPKIPDNLRDIPKHGSHKPYGGKKVVGTKPVKKAPEKVIAGPLSNKIFVITGLLRGYDRDELADILRKYGGKVTGSVSKKTSCLIHGHKLEDGRHYSEGNKFKKAKELDTTIIDESQLEEMLLFLMGGKKKEDLDAQYESISEVQGIVQHDILWTEKYKPKRLKEIVGNVQAVEKLVKWLEDWESVVYSGQRKDIRPVRKGRFDPQLNVNALTALLSGPPGVGKTTAARLVSLGLNYKVTELNASDARSRKAILEPLLSSSKSSCLTESAQIVRSLLIMDEIDGMCAGDRGGVQALVQVIKQTRIPIICICNERLSSKLKSIANHSYDIRFSKPNKLQVTGRMLDILTREGCEVDPNSIEQVVEASGCDVRQCLILLEMWARNNRVVTPAMTKASLRINCKDPLMMIGNFEAAAKLLNKKETRNFRHREKVDLFFVDFDIIPLIIQENYINAMTNEPNQLKRLSLAADSISLADVMNTFMRAKKEWTLLPQYAQLAAIEPATRSGNGVPFPRFPEWFGRNSTQRKTERMLREVRGVLAGNISGDAESVLKDYVPTLYKLIMTPFKAGKFEDTVNTMHMYKITPEMFKEHLVYLQFGSITCLEELKAIPSKDKATLSKLYNSMFKSSVEKVKKKKEFEIRDKFDPELEDEDEVEEEESEEEEIELKPKGKKKKK